MDFVALLKALLVSEYGKTDQEADRLIKAYPDIIIQGIFASNLNATAMALEMKDEQENHGTTKAS